MTRGSGIAQSMDIKYTTRSLSKRLFATTIAIAFFVFLLLIKIFMLTIVNSGEIVGKGLSQWMRGLPLSANRGSITDRNGVVLASSYTTYDVYVRPADMADAFEMSVYLSRYVNKSQEWIYEKIYKKNYSEIKVATGVSKSVVQEMLTNYLPGVFFAENTTREYEYGELLSQILGFVSGDGIGQTGLEKFYNKYLEGIDGKSFVESDLKGTTLDSSTTTYLDAIDGLSVKLTIDYGIQRILEEEIQSAYLTNNATSATGIVMDPNTGEILGIVTKPSVDLSNLPRDDVELLMKLSKATAITDAYEPGSTFKIITTAIAMQEGLTSVHDYFYCPGFRVANGVRINCHRRSGHGSQSLTQGLCNSCNCVFMELVNRIGLSKFYDYLENFGLSTGYHLDFPGEGKGILMPESAVTAGDLLRMGFGQSIAITPLGLLTSVSCIVNGGNLMQPYLMKEIYDKSGNVLYSSHSTMLREVVGKTVSQSINKMLEEVVSKGGGKKASVAGYSIAGKTGTAQKYENGAIASGKYIASFLGYAPSNKPDYILLVIVDEPKGAYYGGTVASPVAKNIFERIFEAKQIERNDNFEKDKEALKPKIEVPNLTGKSLTESVTILNALGLQYLTQGNGKKVTGQISPPGTYVCAGDIILLIFEEESNHDTMSNN